MAFPNMAQLMRHDAQKLARVCGVCQQARMDIDHPFSGNKSVVGRVDNDADLDAARGEPGGFDKRCHKPFQPGFDLAVTDHRRGGAAGGKPDRGKGCDHHPDMGAAGNHEGRTHRWFRFVSGVSIIMMALLWHQPDISAITLG